MTDVWCRQHYCIHNLIGKCALDSIGLMLANDVLGDDSALTCAQYCADTCDSDDVLPDDYDYDYDDNGELDWFIHI